MDFNVGDKVVFKTWEEMEKEYGGDEDSVHARFNFTLPMEMSIVRKEYVIKSIDPETGKVYFTENPIRGATYSFSSDMIEPSDWTDEDREDVYFVNKWRLWSNVEGISKINELHYTNVVTDLLVSALLDQEDLCVVCSNIHGGVNNIASSLQHDYGRETEIVGFIGIGTDDFRNSFAISITDSMKFYAEDNVTLFLVKDANISINSKKTIRAMMDEIDEALPTENESVKRIRNSIREGNYEDVAFRDAYILDTENIRKRAKINKEIETFSHSIGKTKEKALSDTVSRMQAKADDARVTYYDRLNSLDEAKKNLAYFKFNHDSEKDEDFSRILKADVESGILLNFKACEDDMYFTILEPLMYFDDDEWGQLKDGILESSESEYYEPLLDAIFTRKCTCMIEQSASMRIDGNPHYNCLHANSGNERTKGIPNSHMERYDCWDNNEDLAFSYVREGKYDFAYIQMKSAIAGINLCDSPVINDFCSSIGAYGNINCITDKETGMLMTVDEANTYYREQELGATA